MPRARDARTGNRGRIDNPAAALSLHRLKRRARREEGASQIDAQHAIPLFDRDVGDQRPRIDVCSRYVRELILRHFLGP